MPKVEQVSHNTGRGRRGRGQRVSTSLAEINVVPLVDVMLVLLIIFMVSAPMMQQGFAVQLAQSTRSQPVNAEPVYVTVPASFQKDQHVIFDGDRVRLAFLADRVKQDLAGRTTMDVYVGADGQVPWASVVLVMDELKNGGVRNANFVTAPSDGRRRQ